MNRHGYKMKKRSAREVLNDELEKKSPNPQKVARLEKTIQNINNTLRKTAPKNKVFSNELIKKLK